MSLQQVLVPPVGGNCKLRISRIEERCHATQGKKRHKFHKKKRGIIIVTPRKGSYSHQKNALAIEPKESAWRNLPDGKLGEGKERAAPARERGGRRGESSGACAGRLGLDAEAVKSDGINHCSATRAEKERRL